jgi:hypothetical protein
MSGWPVAASQICAVPSTFAVTTNVPSGLKLAEWTQTVWSLKAVSSRPVAASQMALQEQSREICGKQASDKGVDEGQIPVLRKN